MKKVITFDKSARQFILDTFNKSIDQEDYIVEKDNPGQRVLTSDGEEIKLDEFAGIKKGSEVFIKSDLVSLIKLSDDLKDPHESVR